MNEQKGFITRFGEMLDHYRAERHPVASEPAPLKRHGWLQWLGRQIMPNIGTLLLVVVLLVTVPSLAAPRYAPEATSTSAISYQGRLADTAGNPLTGYYNLEFRIYDVPDGGVPLWEEFWTGGNSVQVSDGLFNVMLGSINIGLAAAIEGHDELYLGITVGTDSEMVPRVQLGSVPFAMTAGRLAGRGPGLIQVWEHNDEVSFDATGDPATRITFDTGVDVQVPEGASRYYHVIYRGVFVYRYYDRTGANEAFFGSWIARLVDGSTVLEDARMVQAGYRMQWNAVGGYWCQPYVISWLVELDSGVHSLDIALYGYSDFTMNYGHVQQQNLQVLVLP